MWRTVGFLMSFGVVVELCTLVSFVVIIAGGVQRRVQGWGVVVGVLIFSAFIQGAGMAIVVCQLCTVRKCTSAHNSRPTFSTTTRASSPASVSTPPGPCARHRGLCSSRPHSASQHQLTTFQRRATTSSLQKWISSPMTSECAIPRD